MLFGYRNRLDRRTFLRAGAVSVALPLLDSMLPIGRAADSIASKAKRLVILQRPLGTYAPYFFPETPGPQYEATRFLKLIDAHRGQFTVFSGMSHLGYLNDHRTEFALLSGVRPDNVQADGRHAQHDLARPRGGRSGGTTDPRAGLMKSLSRSDWNLLRVAV